MVNQVLKNLTNALTVQDLMTPLKALERADSLDQAQSLHVEYDVVPYPKTGLISGFFQRGQKDLREITALLLLSNGTSILELPDLLSRNDFYFIISGNSIVGFLHYSDLNNTIAKIPFYTLLQTAERAMWKNIRSCISEEDLPKIFNSSEVKKFKKAKKKNQRKNVKIGWVGVFTFPYILKIAKFYGHTQLSDDEIARLKDVRNRVSHSDRNLITQYNDIQWLVDTYQLTKLLIKSAKFSETRKNSIPALM